MTLSPGRALLLSTLSEEDFLQWVIRRATDRGWWTYHTRDSRRSAKGWPDLVCIRPPRIFFAECKTVTGELTPRQRVVRDLLRACGMEYHEWRPTDEREIEAALA